MRSGEITGKIQGLKQSLAGQASRAMLMARRSCCELCELAREDPRLVRLGLRLARTPAWVLLLLGSAAWLVTLGFVDLRAGDVGLAVPVRYARVSLRARAPTLVKVDLPQGEYEVQPASLGYFASTNEFVYTADEPRGLIYGRSGDEAFVFEIDTPLRAEEFMDEYLARIRGRVSELNTSENELLFARRRFASEADRARQLASLPLGQRTEELAAGALDEWIAKSVAEGPACLERTPEALAASARDRAELKRLYYAAQLRRIDLLLASYDLQLALARLPKPRFAGVLNVGNSTIVTDNLLVQLSTLDSAWTRRRAALELQLRTEGDWANLVTSGMTAGSEPLVQPMALGMSTMGAAPPVASTATPAGLSKAVLDARMDLADAELGELDNAMVRLKAATRYVLTGGTEDRETLPIEVVARREFTTCTTDTVPAIDLIDAEAIGAPQTASLLLGLARAFEDAERDAQLALEGQGVRLEPFPNEVLYGVLAADRRCRIEREGRVAESELLGILGAMLEKPADYKAQDNDLGYLRFVEWYARLSRAMGPGAKEDSNAAEQGRQAAGQLSDAVGRMLR